MGAMVEGILVWLDGQSTVVVLIVVLGAVLGVGAWRLPNIIKALGDAYKAKAEGDRILAQLVADAPKVMSESAKKMGAEPMPPSRPEEAEQP